jgi:sulfur-oxidizing protein SoxX
MKLVRVLAMSALGATAAAAGPAPDRDAGQRAREVMRASFRERGQARLDRLDQDELQQACSRLPDDGPVPAELSARLMAAEGAAIKYPADGNLMGDWKRGEAVAQSGVGMQYSDDPGKPAGGNCYACHELSKSEVSYGTLGPSLRNYGKYRGQSVEIQRYTYGKIYNPQAYAACSIMPRFGHRGILGEAQIKDLVALLLDPASPVNQ